MGEWSPWHLAIIAFVVLVLFGSKRLPDAARSLGRSLRIFKTEMNSLHEDDADGHVGRMPIGDAEGGARRRGASDEPEDGRATPAR
jgi:sec-independent protein translocase protein TatA